MKSFCIMLLTYLKAVNFQYRIFILISLVAAGYWFNSSRGSVEISQPEKHQITLLEIGFVPSIPPREYTNLSVSHTVLSATTEVLASSEKKQLAIHFWAPWCGPCRVELPHFAKFLAANPDVRVWCVADGDQTPQNIQAFYSAQKLSSLPVMIDKGQKLARRMGVENLPTTVFLDKNGKERGRIVGQIAWHNPEVASLILRELLS